MQTPAIPTNESSRIAALHALNILDTAPEERFDRLTRLAKRVFNVPYSTISMIDDQRQWFKSIQGLSLCQTSRDISFCAHAILFDEILYVENALKDERFHDNPVVLGDPKIRFYAGCSLNVNGFKMGTFCVFDKKPRGFTARGPSIAQGSRGPGRTGTCGIACGAIALTPSRALPDVSPARRRSTTARVVTRPQSRVGKAGRPLVGDHPE